LAGRVKKLAVGDNKSYNKLLQTNNHSHSNTLLYNGLQSNNILNIDFVY